MTTVPPAMAMARGWMSRGVHAGWASIELGMGQSAPWAFGGQKHKLKIFVGLPRECKVT